MSAHLLDRIRGTNDIKKLTPEELPGLADEIRQMILDVVLKTGGHLGSNLGVVELTLALHYLFDPKNDLIVWDGSYQTYTHKILTGRKDKFPTLRQFGGLCGFGWKPESDTDPFNFGHVGTGPAVAFGAAIADERLGRKRKVISLIGDGSLTSGVAFEALNNIGASKKDMLVIVNDNGFSISKTVGAISTYFNELRTAPLYDEAKKELHTWLSKIPTVGQTVEGLLDSVRRGLKQALFPNIFTAFGFQYYGPVDGHDLKGLLHLLQNVRHQQKPVLLHVVTQKGKGHPDACKDPFALHKAGAVFVKTNITESKLEPNNAPRPAASKSYTHAFVESLSELAAKDPRIVAITAAMPDGTGLLDFGKRFPDRTFDVGISEQAALSTAAGMAQAGLRPVVAIYSSFVQRGYDMIFQELCLNNLPVVMVLDRAGIAGEDGPTHHGNFDIAFCRTLPNIVCLAPKDETELQAMLAWALAQKQPVSIRIPREQTPTLGALPWHPIQLGKGELLAKGRHGAILAYGVMTTKALEARAMLAKEGLDVAVANARFAKPVDAELAAQLVRDYPWVVTLEDHAAMGGFGSAVLEALSLRNADASKVKIHAIPDRFLQHAERSELLRFLHLDAEGVADVCRMVAAGQPGPTLDPSQRGKFLYEE
ncbi:MAG TPA: 1-deoxy-D-xylulose-5-phosphate synthase [Planctomycetota bacterium]|nr:1-deoxy-D-xylulose-5-phosphate synthase [Planctomycetota bacterium]